VPQKMAVIEQKIEIISILEIIVSNNPSRSEAKTFFFFLIFFHQFFYLNMPQ